VSEQQTDQALLELPPPGVALELTQPYIEKNWAAVESVLRTAESWTQLICAEDIRPQLLDGRMRAWGVLNHAHQALLAVGCVSESARGTVQNLLDKYGAK
jgi:hypothetical protein